MTDQFAPTLRQRLITWYAEIADAERGLCRPEWEQRVQSVVDEARREDDAEDHARFRRGYARTVEV